MTVDENKEALRSLIFLEVEITRAIKERICADGITPCARENRLNDTSPTVL